GATGFVLECEPLAGGSLEIQDQLAEFFRTKENLPEGSSLQFLLISSPRVGEKIDAWKRTSVSSYSTFKERRAEFMLSKSLRDYRVLISFSMPGLALSPEKEEGMIRIRTNLRSTLKQLGMYTSVLDAKGLISNLRNILMPSNGYQEKTSWNKMDALAKQILPPNFSMHVEEDSVSINDQLFKTFLPKSSPDYWSLPSQDLLIGDISKLDSQIPVPYFIHYGIHVLGNQSGALAKQVSRRGTLENSLKNALTKWMPGLEEQYEETVAAVKEMQKGERLVISNFSVTLMCEKKQLEEATSKLKSIWSAAEWDLESAVYNQLPMLLSSLPMMWTLGDKEGWAQNLSAMGVGKKSITKESQNLLPIIAEWKGQTVGMPLYGRRGQVFFWSPFGEGLLPQSKAQTDHNFNLCIAGQSGSGKSVFAQELMMNILSVGGRVFVLDYGRSFKKACQLMKGQHIEFDIRDPLSLNPFTHIPVEKDPESIATREEMLACLKPTIQAMAAPKQGTSDLENSFIEKAIRHVWNTNGQDASIDGIQEYLLSQENIEAKNLGQTLYPFSGQGVYGRFFSGKAGANLTEDFVVIETDHLRSHPDLLTVLVQMVMIQIHQTMARGDRSRPTMIMIDEAWKLLAGKSTGAFIAEMNRIARKYKVAICMATQHMTDYFKPECPAATEAFNASAWKVMLYQESDVIEAFHDHHQLKTFVEQKGQEKVLKSLRSVIPHFSEAAIFGPGVKGAVGRLSLDPYSRLLFSTNPVEYQELEKRTAQGMSVSEAIEDYLGKKVRKAA
ncbi:TraC family protein, partial [Alphaproteobacteria bacterium]|nr:TraC family protein [Alphaproteobacteria bacterium]